MGILKKRSKVSLRLCSVIFYERDYVQLRSEDGYLFCLDKNKYKSIKSFDFAEGNLFWVYYADINKSFVSIVPYGEEIVNEMPLMDDVEV